MQLALIFGALTALLALPTGLQAQELPLRAQELPLHMDVRLVNVFVSVSNRNGGSADGLARDEFALTEDGRPQKIALFERQPELPLNLTLAIDTSGSVQKDLVMEAGAAKGFAHALLRPQDWMSLLEFDAEVHELTPFTDKLSVIDRGLGQLHGGSATALYDAVCMGSARLGKLAGRRVLVVISDGDDTAKGATYQKALEEALRNDVILYSLIDVPIEASAGRDLAGEHALIALSEETGGKSFYVNDGNLEKAFQRVGEELRTQYLLGYYPRDQEPGKAFHRIQVTIPDALAGSFTIRYRSGYYTDRTNKIR